MPTVKAPEAEQRKLTLMAAHQDGLLEYARRRGDVYDVTVTGRRLHLPADQVLDTVARLRLLARKGADLGVELVDVDQSADLTIRYVLRVDQVDVELPGDQVTGWVKGYGVALGVAGEHTSEDGTSELRRVLVTPSLADQCRLHLLACMAADGVTIKELAARVDHTEKTVSKALRFGEWFGMDFADESIRALGRRWTLTVEDGVDGPRLVPSGSVPGELPGVSRLRRLLDAHDRGLIRYVGPESMTRAHKAARFRLAVGAKVHEVPAADVDGWVRGVAAARGEAAA